MKSRSLSLKTIIKELNFIKKAVIIQWDTKKKNRFIIVHKQINRKTPDPHNADEYYQLFSRKKKRNSVKQIEIIIYQRKTFENPNTVDIRLIITKYPNISHKLPKTIRQAEKVVFNSSLHNNRKKTETCLNKKNMKITNIFNIFNI